MFRRTLLCALAFYCPYFAFAQRGVIPDSITLRPGCEVVDGALVDCEPDIQLPLQEYLTVVVASEMSAYWGDYDSLPGGENEGMHALMAQAVAARSYAIQYESEHGFVCDHPQACQKYNYEVAEALGVAAVPKVFPPLPSNSHYNAYLAVKNTEGFVLTWPAGDEKSGQPAPAYYAASTNSYIGPETSSHGAAGVTCLSGSTPVDGVSGGTFSFPCFEDADVGVNGASVFPNKGFPRLGHGAGLSQTGALRWATGRYWNPDDLAYRNATYNYAITPYVSTTQMGDPIPNIVTKDWLQILSHYYVRSYTKLGRLSPYNLSIIPDAGQSYVFDADAWAGIDVYLKNGVQVHFSDAGSFIVRADHTGRKTRVDVEAGSQMLIWSVIEVDNGSAILCGGECTYQAGAKFNGSDNSGNGSHATVRSGGTLRLGRNTTSTFSNGAFLKAEAGSMVILEENATVLFDAAALGNSIQLAPGATFFMEKNAKIIFEVPVLTGHALDDILRYGMNDPTRRWRHLTSNAQLYSYIVFDRAEGRVEDSLQDLQFMLAQIALSTQTTKAHNPINKLARNNEHPDVGFFVKHGAFALGNAYPNPFNSRSIIPFTLAEHGRMQLEVYDMMGRRVTTLANGDYSPGEHNVFFDGSTLPGGVYMLRASIIREDGKHLVQTRQLTLVK